MNKNINANADAHAYAHAYTQPQTHAKVLVASKFRGSRVLIRVFSCCTATGQEMGI